MDLGPADSPWDDVPSQSETAQNPANEDKPPTARTPGGSSHPNPLSASPLRSPTSRKLAARKVGAQPTRLEAVDGSLDPLGPLGAEEPTLPSISSSSDQAPTPPRKESSQARNLRPPAAAQQASVPGGAVDPSDNDATINLQRRTRGPPPVQPAAAGNLRQTQPSVSIEQAAKPSFAITVGDPHKVGGKTGGHIVYQVRTKTTSKAYQQPDFAVSRRYRDFLWLYNSLHNNNPGIVVPPPPEKQAVGRFDTSFVESRRQALERMLNKISAHPVLQHDADLKIFLESDSFGIDIKNKENREPDLGQNKGMFSSLGINVGGSGGKFVEHDDWFHDRKIYLDALENQLKALLKTIDVVVSQRKGLAEAAGDFAASLSSLASVELSPSLSGPLAGLADVQLRIRELYERQAQQDVLTLGITIDEYIRLISSIKQAFQQRQKAYHSWHNAESELQKRRSAHEKLLRQGRSQQDKLNEVGAAVADAERRAHSARLLFDDMGRLMRGELERFEKEKVEDFKSGVETFLEGAVEAQKELIEIWETFLLQLDAEEGEDPFYKPNPQPSSTGTRKPDERTTSTAASGQNDAEAAAIATVEQEA